MIKQIRGFTLIELLAVIAIIAVLFAIIIPVIGRVRSFGQNSVCQSNLRQIWTACNLYATEHHQFPQSAYDENDEYVTWYQILLGQMGSTKYDANSRTFVDGSGETNYLGSREVLGCPSGHWHTMGRNPGWPLSYAMTDLPVWYPRSTRTDDVANFFTGQLIQPSEWPVFMDADAIRIFDLDNPVEGAGEKLRYTVRHNDFANIIMADGHIEQAAYGDTRWDQFNLNRNNYYDH